MAKIDILAKVDADLARGHTHPATQRLASLLADEPGDPALRARLAAVHRRTGNLAEAGRWGFLTEDVTEPELAAFTRTFRTARTRLRSLRLRGDHPSGLGPLATARYTALIEQAAQEPGDPIDLPDAEPPSARERFLDFLAGLFFFGPLALMAALMVLGLVTVVRWFL